MLSITNLVVGQWIGVGFALLLLYLIGGAVYRLYFSPLARFPGPKLAALTLWYEFYFDVVKRGRYTWEIGKMHQKYGPIVRINPYELHINDPDYYDELYCGGSKKRDKYEWATKLFGNSESMLGTISHEHHRMRRQALNPFFSKQSVTKLEPAIGTVVESLCRRLQQYRNLKEAVNIGDAYAALTIDIITEYCFAKCYGCVDKSDFAPEWLNAIMVISAQSALNKQFPSILKIMKMMPESMVEKFSPDMMLMINFQKDMLAQATAVVEGKYDSYSKTTHVTVFKELLDSGLPPDEVTMQRLAQEAQTVIGAGQVTTAHFLKMTSFHILANPEIHTTLKQELNSVMPGDGSLAPLSKLEQLPYLSAVISEGFRKTYGVTQRLPRVSPDAPLVYKSWVIPPGTPVGMTSIFMHDNPEHFPNPEVFDPNRWLNADSERRLGKYLVNFSKGTRSCLGMNLAKAEIYLTLAAVFHRFDMELYETDRSDVDIVHDYFNPSPRHDSKGVRVLIK